MLQGPSDTKDLHSSKWLNESRKPESLLAPDLIAFTALVPQYMDYCHSSGKYIIIHLFAFSFPARLLKLDFFLSFSPFLNFVPPSFPPSLHLSIYTNIQSTNRPTNQSICITESEFKTQFCLISHIKYFGKILFIYYMLSFLLESKMFSLKRERWKLCPALRSYVDLGYGNADAVSYIGNDYFPF